MRPIEPLGLIDMAAHMLGDYSDEVIYLGGSVLGFLITDPYSRKARMTDDADVIVEATTKLEYHKVEERLRHLGFEHDPFGPICRFKQGGLILDVMPVDESVLGFSNQWYPFCLKDWHWETTPKGRKVRVISGPCFLACKIDAFRSPTREGNGDYLASRDFEDVVSVLDGRPELAEELLTTPIEVRGYLAAQAKLLLADPKAEFGIECCLDPDGASQGRVGLILDRLRNLAAMQ